MKVRERAAWACAGLLAAVLIGAGMQPSKTCVGVAAVRDPESGVRGEVYIYRAFSDGSVEYRTHSDTVGGMRINGVVQQWRER